MVLRLFGIPWNSIELLFRLISQRSVVWNLTFQRLFFLNFLMLSEVYVINWSSVGINNLSIAHCNPHKLVTIPDEWVSIDRVFFFLSFIQPWIWAISFVSVLILLNFSKIIEFIEGGLSDRNHLFYNIPKDSFRAWNSGQGALVSPPSVELQKLHKLG